MRRVELHRWLAALLVAVGPVIAATGIAAQEAAPAAPASIASRVKVRVGVPLLVATTLDTEMSGTQSVEGEVDRPFRLAHREEREFIDELIAFDSSREETVRTYLRAAATAADEIVDPGLEGVALRYLRDGEKTSLRLDGERRLPQSDLADFLRALESTGIWLEMPQRWALAERHEIDLRPLAPLLLGHDLRFASARASLVLESIDAGSNAATLRGTSVVEAIRPARAGSPEFSLRVEGAIEIRLDTAEQRIASIDLAGEGRVATAQGVSPRWEGAGSVRARLTTRVPEDAAALRAVPPVFRAATRRAGSLGLAVTVPSHWTPPETKDGLFALTRGLEKSLGEATMLLFPMGAPGATLDTWSATIEGLYAARAIAFEREEIDSPLGKGRAYRIREAKGERTLVVRTEILPWRDRWVHFQLVADETAYETALPEFLAARATLRSRDPPPAPPPARAGESGRAGE